MVTTCDVVVLGLGGIGSATAYQLARRGFRTIAVDQFSPAHDRGSSHGQTRVIRQAYFEHPDYVPLLRRAYENWSSLEQETGQELFIRCGLMEIGPDEGPLISGVIRSSLEYQIPVEKVDNDRFQVEYPQFRLPTDCVAVFEPDAGYLLVEDCVRAFLQQATQHGAQLQFECPVQRWEFRAPNFVVTTATTTIEAPRLVVCAGAWAQQQLADEGLDCHVLLKHLYWYDRIAPMYHRDAGCPVFLYELPSGMFYGFPAHDARGLKAGEHTGGILAPHGPEDRIRQSDLNDRRRVADFLRDHLPGVQLALASESTCWYTMSPDGHFIVDRSSTFPGLSFAAGLSGHGFKFAPVLGEILADLAMVGTTPLPYELFRISRFTG